jgi:hypothetical protein
MNVLRRAEWPGRPAAERLRQWATLEQLAERLGATPDYLGMILVGSLAKGVADPLSDIDLFLVARDGGFAAVWERRHDLHVTGALAVWEQADGRLPDARTHVWLTEDLVVVEALIATPQSGARLAEPAVVLVGPPELTDMFPRRPPVQRSEMRMGDHPVERAYDALKRAVRRVSFSS